MRNPEETDSGNELSGLTGAPRERIGRQARGDCGRRIAGAMSRRPRAPQPRNLMGSLLEAMGGLCGALRYFCGAWALAPGCLPARCELGGCAGFYPAGGCAYDESDCPDRRLLARQRDSGAAGERRT